MAHGPARRAFFARTRRPVRGFWALSGAGFLSLRGRWRLVKWLEESDLMDVLRLDFPNVGFSVASRPASSGLFGREHILRTQVDGCFPGRMTLQQFRITVLSPFLSSSGAQLLQTRNGNVRARRCPFDLTFSVSFRGSGRHGFACRQATRLRACSNFSGKTDSYKWTSQRRKATTTAKTDELYLPSDRFMPISRPQTRAPRLLGALDLAQ